MNKQVITEEDILNVSKKFILEKGWVSFNIRTIAKECGISVGTVYNYFPSKTQLVIVTVESVWKEIFKPLQDLRSYDSFINVIKSMYETIEYGNTQYPEFFTIHSLSFASEGKSEGVQMMNSFFSKLKQDLLYVLRKDEKVKANRFDHHFSEEKFIDYIFTLILSSLLSNKESCTALLTFISNYIY